MKKTLIPALIFALIFAPIHSAAAKNKKIGYVKTVHSGITVIYTKESDAADLFRNLLNRRTPNEITLKENDEEKKKAAALAERIAQIFAEVMKLSKIEKLRMSGREKVVILKDMEQLHALYRKFYNKEPGRCDSFYSASRKTVYTTEESMSAKILSHELTHMINDLYYKGTLPREEDERRAYRMEVNFKL